MNRPLALAAAALALLSSAASAASVPYPSDGHFLWKSGSLLSAYGCAAYGRSERLKSDEDNTTLDLYAFFGEEALQAWARPLGEGRYERHIALLKDGVWRRGPEQQPAVKVLLESDGKTPASVEVSIVDDDGATVTRTFARKTGSCTADGDLTRENDCCGQPGERVSDTAVRCGY